MRFSVSEVLEWQKCPRSWWHKYRVKRARPPAQALEDGTFWHQAALAELTGVALPQPVNPEQERMASWIRANLRERMTPWEIVELERQKSAALGAHTLLGTPDGTVITRETGVMYNLQWKTVASNRPIDILLDEVRVSWHECAYEWMVRAEHPAARFGGTLLGAWRKLTQKQVKEGEQPFLLMPLTRAAHEVDSAVSELRALADDMERATTANLIQNRRSCVQYNWRCGYFEVCYGGARLEEEPFVNVTERYVEVE